MNPRIFFLSFLCLLSLSGWALNVEANKGIVDLSDWNPQHDPIVSLSGEWEIYWNQLIDPSTDEFPKNPDYWNGESSWNDYLYQGEKVGGVGYATYRVVIQHLPDVPLNLQVTNVLTACKVWINGQLVAEVGTVGTSVESSSPHYENRIVPIGRDLTTLELVVQISNFEHRKGGFAHPFKLGTEKELYTAQREIIFLDGVVSSCYLFSGIFFLTLWVFRKKDKTLLFMSLFCLTISPRALTSGDYMINTVLPELNWSLLVHVEYLSMFLPFAFILLFIREKYPKQTPRRLIHFFAGFMFLQALITFLTPISIFSWLVVPHQYASILSFLLMIWIIVRAMRDYENGSYFAGSALLCLITWASLIILEYMNLIEPVPYSMAGLQIGFLLSMSLIIGARFSANYTKVEALQEETQEQKEELETQKMMLEVKNNEVLSSISYAKRIQAAILPPLNKLRELKPNSFVIYRPKDIVAGDFYWIEEEGDYLFVAVADCTGHGVPGAMVSVICHAALNRSIREFGLTDPAEILNKTRDLVLETFEQSEEKVKDGMDIGLCAIHARSNIMRFAGANSSVYIVPTDPRLLAGSTYEKYMRIENRELFEYKGDKQPIGTHPHPKPFTTIEIPISSGDCLYMSSDGYPDQFGGQHLPNIRQGGKKFMHKRLKQLLLTHAQSDFETQRNLLIDQFQEWKSDMEQTDDVCVMGIKI